MKKLQSISGVLLDEIVRKYPHREYGHHTIPQIHSFRDVQIIGVHEKKSTTTIGITCNGSWIHILLFAEGVHTITKHSAIIAVFAVESTTYGEFLSCTLRPFAGGDIRINVFSPATLSVFLHIQQILHRKCAHPQVLN